MKSQNMDDQFKRIIENSEDHYKEFSEKAKSNIWQEIQSQENKPNLFLWKRLAIAASILLMFSFAFGYYYSKKQNERLVAHLKTEILALKNKAEYKNRPKTPTTQNVIVEKNNIVKVPVVKTEIIETVKYIHDTVFVKQVVVEYIEKENTAEVQPYADNSKQEIAQQTEKTAYTEIILTGKSREKQRKPFSFAKFLDRRMETKTNAESTAIMVFTAKL